MAKANVVAELEKGAGQHTPTMRECSMKDLLSCARLISTMGHVIFITYSGLRGGLVPWGLGFGFSLDPTNPAIWLVEKKTQEVSLS